MIAAQSSGPTLMLVDADPAARETPFETQIDTGVPDSTSYQATVTQGKDYACKSYPFFSISDFKTFFSHFLTHFINYLCSVFI